MVGNPWKIVGPVLEVVKNLSTPSVIFGSCQEIFGKYYLWKLSEIFGNNRNSSEIFSNLWKLSVNLWKFSFSGDGKSRAF